MRASPGREGDRIMSKRRLTLCFVIFFAHALVAGVDRFYDLTIFARPGITRLEQLKGKRLGISGYGAATHFAALIVAKHLNLDPNKDMTLVPGGPDAERVAALSAGKIDASVFNSSTVPVAKRMGFIELVYLPDLGVEVQGNGVATTRAYLKSIRQIHADRRSGSARTVLSGVRENDPQETLSNHEGAPVPLGRAGAPDAAGEER